MADQNTTNNQNPNTPAAGQPTQPNYDEIFNKLDAILDKRSEGLAKSVLKGDGIQDTEIAEIVKAYREQKQSKANEQESALTEAQKTIASLQQQISDRDLSDAFSASALELGVETKQIPYLIRLVGKEGLVDADGKPDAEKAKEAIHKVLEDIPAFKASQNDNKGFQPVGSKTGDGAGSGEDAQKKLRSYFGLK